MQVDLAVFRDQQVAVAQLAARRSHNPKVVSSILTCHICDLGRDHQLQRCIRVRMHDVSLVCDPTAPCVSHPFAMTARVTGEPLATPW